MSGSDTTSPAKRLGIGNRLAPARFVGFLALFAIGWFAYRKAMPLSDWRDAAAIAFDGAAALFLISLMPLLRDSSTEAMRRRASENDANRWIVLLVSVVLTVVVMFAIQGELRAAGKGEIVPILKLVATLALAWLFANSVFALHYAHMFYDSDPETGGDCQGFDFPGTPMPDYADFTYFAYTLGMTFQTSDVAITNRRVRVVAIFHAAAAFVYSIGVIAFTINTLGGSS
jgi:uncharacterized membrane protein